VSWPLAEPGDDAEPEGRVAPTLKDLRLEHRLDLDGFVVLRLMNADRAEALLAELTAQGRAPGDPGLGLFNDTWSTDRSFTQRRSLMLSEVFDAPLASHLVDHQALIWCTSVKWPGVGGVVGPHRDPTFVDERRFRSVGIFCALSDLTQDTGTLEVLPGSHRHSLEVRIHQSERNLLPDLPSDVENDFVPVVLSAGEAVVYDHSLVHRSSAQRSGAPRIAAMSVVVPSSAAVTYAVRIGDGSAAVLEVGPELFLDHRMDDLDVDLLLSTHRIDRAVDDPPGFGALR